MTAEKFLMALTRFISRRGTPTAEKILMTLTRFIFRRGTPKVIILDNVPQFKLTKTTIDKA